MPDLDGNKTYEFGDFRLIPHEGLLLRVGLPVPMAPKVFETLLLLVERQGTLVTKTEVMDAVWADSFVEENAVSKAIWSIRQALGEDPKNPEFIQTVTKRGYRFVAEVRTTEAAGDGTGAAKPYVESPKPSSAERITRRPLLIIGFAALALMAITVGLGWSFGGWFRSGSAGTVKSLTILPFENLSGDPANDYLVDGVTDSLTADLSRLSELSFIPLPKKFRDGSESNDPREIGLQLGVDAVLNGSVVRSPDRIRITVQLIQPATGKNLWGNTYESDASDLQSLQKEVALRLAEKIGGILPPKDAERLHVRHAADPKAYDEFQRAKYYINRQNSEDQLIAIAELEHAVEIDPNYALAYAELAQAYTWDFFSFSPEKTAEFAKNASIATAKALDLDPELPEVYLARGRVLWTPTNKFPHERAIQEYKHALELDPKLAEAKNQLALVYSHIGALDDALRESYEALKLTPEKTLLLLRIGQSMNSQGRYKEALPILQGIPEEVHPSMIGHQTAWALLNLGRTDEAAAVIDQFSKKHPRDRGGTYASIRAVLSALAGNHLQAEKFINEALEKGKGFGHFHHTAYTIACAYALMNKPDKAIKYLEMAADTGFPCYPAFENEPTLNNIRQDPRYIEFMARLKDKWETIRRNSGI